MAVDIRFYNADGITPISIDKITGGLNFGTVKKNQQAILPVVIKNLGTSDANNLYVVGSPLHSSTEVDAPTYANEVYAGKWKTFSMLNDGTYSNTLTLPNIKAGQTMLGVKKYIESFTNPMASLFTNDTLPLHTFNWTGSSVKINAIAPAITIFARMDAVGFGSNKEIDLTFQCNSPATLTTGQAFVMPVLRQNSIGDNKGYIINIKRTANATTGGTCFFEIRKGQGMSISGVNDFGTVLATSSTATWADFTNIRVKLFTNANNLPEIKIWVTNIADTDPSVLWAVGTTSSYIDTLNTYPNAGKVVFIFGSSNNINLLGANEFEMRSVTLKTDDPVGKVYIKDAVGDGAVDAVTFNSSMELFYAF